jgi:ABC-type transport system involved in cytochrome bd biosynthesis fused ATPase/permease subunit
VLALVLALVVVLVLVALDPPLAAVPALVVLLLLLPHAARSIAAPTSAASANARTRTPWRSLLTSVLLLEMDYVESAPVWRGAHVIGARTCMQHRPNQT